MLLSRGALILELFSSIIGANTDTEHATRLLLRDTANRATSTKHASRKYRSLFCGSWTATACSISAACRARSTVPPYSRTFEASLSFFRLLRMNLRKRSCRDALQSKHEVDSIIAWIK